MEIQEYARLARRGLHYFWNVGRREILREVLRRHIIPSSIQPKRVCPICSTLSNRVYREKSGFVLMSCITCGIVFIPRQHYVENPAIQYQQDETSPAHYYVLTASSDKKNFERTFIHLEHHAKPGMILDVGASVGTFLEVARKRGWNGVGVEPNSRSVAIARSKGLEMREGFFDEDCLNYLRLKAPAGFDAIHMGDVIEHVFEPLDLLRRANKVLRPGGILAIVTPDIDRWLARRYQIKPREHLIYFTKPSLKIALSLSGFKPIFIGNQTRIRDIGNIEKGTVKLSVAEKLISTISKAQPFKAMIGALLAAFKDEVIAIAQKTAD